MIAGFSQNLPSNPGTSFGIGQGVVVVELMVAAGLGHGVQLMVGQHLSEVFARSAAGAIELIVRVIHLIAAHYGLQATFVERAVVGYERQALNQWLYLVPNIRENGRVLGVGLGDAMYERVPIKVIVRLRLDKGIKRVHELAFFHNHHTHAAHAGALVVGGLEVDGGEVVHD